jgi:shikimate dehydrogenase
VCGLIGHPVAHSLSPAIHNAALRHDGRDGEYRAFDVTDATTALRELAEQGLVGVNVTIPHKRAVWELATRRSAAAEQIGAANTIVFEEDGGVAAHNTDPDGVLGALRDLGVDPSGAACLVIGAGGAGRAAIWALRRAGASSVAVVNRTESRGAEVASELGADVVPWDLLGRALEDSDIVVNATSLGMDEKPSPLSEIVPSSARGVVLDLVYSLGETDLVRTARASGLVAADGLSVLVHQAAKSYELFWGSPAPIEVMTHAAAAVARREPGDVRPNGARG